MSPPFASRVRFAWAVGVVLLAFVEAIARLGARALHTLAAGLGDGEALVFAVLVVAFAWGEGVLALHRRFVPRVVSAALALEPGEGWWAPLRVLGLLGGTRGARWSAWASVVLIVIAAVVVAHLPAPWRGLVDGAVAVALAIGATSLAGRAVAAWSLARWEVDDVD